MIYFTPEHEAVRKNVRKIAEEAIAPLTPQIDESAEFSWEVVDIVSEAGLLNLTIPAEYGGEGADMITTCIVVEEISRVNASTGNLISTQSACTMPILVGGSEEQKKRFLGRLCQERSLGAFAITEPEAGSDVSSIQTRAVRKGDDYVLNGRKSFITNASLASLMVVFATTDPSLKHKGISAFVVEKGTPGLSCGPDDRKMGLRGQTTCDVILEDAVIPRTNLLGNEGDGFKIAMKSLNKPRLDVGAQSVGLAQGALDYVTRYAKERVQFGKPIAEHQAIQLMLADMAMQIEAARALLYHAAWLWEQGHPQLTKFCAMVKCFASDAAMRVTTDAVQVMGGHGYMKDHPVERMMRDAKVTQIYDGTNQIQRLVIARNLLKG